MQKHHVDKLTLLDHAKCALKMATSWYTREKILPVAMDCCCIRLQKVKPEYNGVDPHPATIWKYVNANIAGMSPLKPGVKGDIAACMFKSLSVAFKTYVRIEQINL